MKISEIDFLKSCGFSVIGDNDGLDIIDDKTNEMMNRGYKYNAAYKTRYLNYSNMDTDIYFINGQINVDYHSGLKMAFQKDTLASYSITSPNNNILEVNVGMYPTKEVFGAFNANLYHYDNQDDTNYVYDKIEISQSAKGAHIKSYKDENTKTIDRCNNELYFREMNHVLNEHNEYIDDVNIQNGLKMITPNINNDINTIFDYLKDNSAILADDLRLKKLIIENKRDKELKEIKKEYDEKCQYAYQKHAYDIYYLNHSIEVIDNINKEEVKQLKKNK